MEYVAEISYAREGCGLLDKLAWVNFEKAETARKTKIAAFKSTLFARCLRCGAGT